jgi:hypothetical protein
VKDLKTASQNELARHGDQVGWNDVYYRLDEMADIPDDDLQDAVSDGAWDSYNIARPHLQRIWEALTENPLSQDSPIDELFGAVSRLAYERGFLAGMALKKR